MVKQSREPFLPPFPCCFSHTAQSLGTLRSPRSVSDGCWVERCSPWPAPLFSPELRRRLLFSCSSGSSIVWCGPTPPEACVSALWLCTFADRPRALAGRGALQKVSRFSKGHVVSSACAGSPTTQDRLLARVYRESAVVPSSISERVGVLVLRFSKLVARPTGTSCSTLQEVISRCRSCTDSGPRWIRCSFLVRLFHSLQHAGLTGRSPD